MGQLNVGITQNTVTNIHLQFEINANWITSRTRSFLSVLRTRLQPARLDEILLHYALGHRVDSVVERWPAKQYRFQAKVPGDRQVEGVAQL